MSQASYFSQTISSLLFWFFYFRKDSMQCNLCLSGLGICPYGLLGEAFSGLFKVVNQFFLGFILLLIIIILGFGWRTCSFHAHEIPTHVKRMCILEWMVENTSVHSNCITYMGIPTTCELQDPSRILSVQEYCCMSGVLSGLAQYHCVLDEGKNGPWNDKAIQIIKNSLIANIWSSVFSISPTREQ